MWKPRDREGILQEYIAKWQEKYPGLPPMPIDEFTGKDLEEGDEFIVLGEDVDKIRDDLGAATYLSWDWIDITAKSLRNGKIPSKEKCYKIGEALSEMAMELYRVGQVAD